MNQKNMAGIILLKSVSTSNLSRLEKQCNNSKCKTTLHCNCVYSKYRKWQLRNTNDNVSTRNGLTFKLVSYNILAQDLLVEHNYLYSNCAYWTLNWSHRLNKIVDEILILKPHIICFQEVQADHLGSIVKTIGEELQMDFIFKKKTGLRTDGCAVFYNNKMFQLVQHHTVEFFHPGSEHLNRNNIAIIANLSVKSQPDTKLIVATTHLLYNPKRQDVRLAQIQLLLAELDKHSVKEINDLKQVKRLPIILTGDFNLEPMSAPYKLLTEGTLFYEKLSKNSLIKAGTGDNVIGKIFLPSHLGITDRCQHIDTVKSTYKGTTNKLLNTNSGCINKTEDNVNTMEYNSYTFSTGTLSHDLDLNSVYLHKSNNSLYASTFQNTWATVDYIFYSKNSELNQENLVLLNRYELPSVNECHEMGRLPNDTLGSDHFALAAVFFLKLNQKDKY